MVELSLAQCATVRARVTPWGTWLTCEETTVSAPRLECSKWAPDIGDPTPLVDMGRFSHEAGMVDPVTGYIYETEDSNDCGFSEFVPNRPGRPASGGTLYMLKVKDTANADLGISHGVGQTWDVEWVPIADPTAATMSVFAAGICPGWREVPSARRLLVG